MVTNLVAGMNVIIIGEDKVLPIYALVNRGANLSVQLYDASTNTMIVKKVDQVEPVASEVFKIGDQVEAIFPGNCGFRGEVVAFESATNRVICRSLNASNPSRQRYAYKVSELALMKSVDFIPGHIYVINDKMTVLTVEVNPAVVTLVDASNYKVKYPSISKHLCRDEASCKGIHKVQYVSTGEVVNFRYKGQGEDK